MKAQQYCLNNACVFRIICFAQVSTRLRAQARRAPAETPRPLFASPLPCAPSPTAPRGWGPPPIPLCFVLRGGLTRGGALRFEGGLEKGGANVKNCALIENLPSQFWLPATAPKRHRISERVAYLAF